MFEDCTYLPLLSLKPAEMSGLQQLPESVKDAMLPHFFLKRWGASHVLQNSIQRIDQAIGGRPRVLELALEQASAGEPQQVHAELAALRVSAGGYSNWRQFVEERENVVPVLQIGQLAELPTQVSGFDALGRGMALRLPAPAFPFIGSLSQILASNVSEDSRLCVILDFERQGQYLLNRQAEAAGYINTIRQYLPGSRIALSASSFPDSFSNIAEQDIFERLLYEGVQIATGDPRLIYSDRGSARAEALGGGGGDIPPRVDYALPNGWSFFRATTSLNRQAQYLEQASLAIESSSWDEQLNVWGTQLIERTAAGETNAIYSQATAAAARINIHLYRQQYYGQADIYDTDEDWTE